MKYVLQFAVILLLSNCKPDLARKNNSSTFPSKLDTFVFETQNSGCIASLRGVFAVDDKVAWASGSNATFVRTINGGMTWSAGKIAGAGNTDFRDVQAFNADTAILLSAGEPAMVFKTTNGGRNWHETYFNGEKGVFFNSMAFWDKLHGVAISDPVHGSFLIIVTEDGGESWTTVPEENIPQPYPGEAGFAASGTCVTVYGQSTAWFATGGVVSRVFKSIDKGTTWTASITPFLNKSASTGIYSIVFTDSLYGIAVGGDWQNPPDTSENILVTKDGGKIWLKPGSIPSGFRSCVCFVKKSGIQAAVAVGPSGSDYSTDNGEHWRLLNTTGYNSISFAPNTSIGWAVGPGGRVAKIKWE